MPRRKKEPANRYELVTCAWKGHALVGTDAAEVTPEDALVVREGDGVRWYRCLRCDAWINAPIPSEPSEERVTPAMRSRFRPGARCCEIAMSYG